jgi:hypothetical protein
MTLFLSPGVEKIEERPMITMAVGIAVHAMPVEAATAQGPVIQAVTSMTKRSADEATVS